ncbi:MAG: Crp/Fnr family transcriptional regulator [Dokdonella sp.]|uniref:Crp/Fnr family transcriptional regulator n=1 Tax=Dokdonella sp. TaxID=2291710 RepID=UPI003263DFE5
MIARLPVRDRKSLLSLCEPVELALSDVLSEPGQRARYVYFPNTGFVSLIAEIAKHPGLEVGMIGREGMLGAHVSLGIDIEPIRAIVQGVGVAWRVRAADFRNQLAGSDALRRAMNRYLYAMFLVMANAAGCVRFHQLGPRLARWFLMSQDRARADHFQVTHEFLAYMLGVRRVGVTDAAGELQRRGLVTYHRGRVKVLDRVGLEAAACSCYATDGQAFARWMG